MQINNPEKTTMVVRVSSSLGDVVARELRESIVKQVKDRTGIDIPGNQTIDQMIRTAAKFGVKFTLVSYIG